MRTFNSIGCIPRNFAVWSLAAVISLVSCARKTTTTAAGDKSEFPRSAGAVAIQTGDASNAALAKGRQISLFDIRAAMFASALPPSLDTLPCPYFKQGPQFNIAVIPGGPPVPIPGPIQNYYSGNWNGESQYTFRVSLWNRIYHDPGVPDWTMEQPDRLSTQYVPKLFDFVVTNANKPGCSMTARRLN